jgi:short subunit dehydrogenase-like uncharacterized protein
MIISSMPTLMIYGASGYTGRLASEHAKSSNLDFIIAGRAADTIAHLASALQVPHRAFDLEDQDAIDIALAGIKVLLNCAGPFARTAEPLMDGCIRNSIHYLDISAELDTYLMAERKNEAAGKAGVMLLPGCGGSVTMLGCLAGYALKVSSGSHPAWTG